MKLVVLGRVVVLATDWSWVVSLVGNLNSFSVILRGVVLDFHWELSDFPSNKATKRFTFWRNASALKSLTESQCTVFGRLVSILTDAHTLNESLKYHFKARPVQTNPRSDAHEITRLLTCSDKSLNAFGDPGSSRDFYLVCAVHILRNARTVWRDNWPFFATKQKTCGIFFSNFRLLELKKIGDFCLTQREDKKLPKIALRNMWTAPYYSKVSILKITRGCSICPPNGVALRSSMCLSCGHVQTSHLENRI